MCPFVLFIELFLTDVMITTEVVTTILITDSVDFIVKKFKELLN